MQNLKNYIFLSYTLSKKTPRYGNTPSMEIVSDKQLKKGDSCNTSFVRFHNHLGTHVDAPKHFSLDGRSIAEYCAEEFIFNNPFVIDCAKSPDELITLDEISNYELKKYDILFFNTGFWKYRTDEIYRFKNPGISPDVALYIRSKFPNIRCIGIDSISVSSYSNRELGRKTHQIFLNTDKDLSEPILLLEDVDLSNDNACRLKTVIICPLLIENVDSSPCTIIGMY